jgi:hypothetical protein
MRTWRSTSTHQDVQQRMSHHHAPLLRDDCVRQQWRMGAHLTFAVWLHSAKKVSCPVRVNQSHMVGVMCDTFNLLKTHDAALKWIPTTLHNAWGG